MLPLRSGPLHLVSPSPCCCCSPSWTLVTVSLQPGPDGDCALTVRTAGGDCLYTLPLSSLTVDECTHSYRDRCFRRRETTFIRLEGREQLLLLWAEKEDRKGWLDALASLQGETRHCSLLDMVDSRIIACVDSSTAGVDRSTVGFDSSAASVEGSTAAASLQFVDSSTDATPGVITHCHPCWLAEVPRVVRIESDMITFNYDQMFMDLQPLEANMERGKTQVVASVVRQLITTMNPSKVRLPACVLECRSLLESYADAFGRPELFNNITTGRTEMKRLEKVTSFYLSQLKCMRSVSCVSKPYNPVHGELFICSWPEAEFGSLHFVAEQISHHPPVSAFYAECSEADISLTCTLFTKSGLRTSWLPPFLKAMTVDNIGQATIHLGSHAEVYTMTYPTAVATGILGSSPRLLLNGGVSITCSSHMGRVELTFEEESLVSGTVFGVGSGEQVAMVEGDWRGLVEICQEDGRREVLLDMSDWAKPRVEKVVPLIAEQLDLESRRLWRLLTRALAGYMTEMEADTAKRSVEDWARNLGDDKRQLQFFKVDSQNVEFIFSKSQNI